MLATAGLTYEDVTESFNPWAKSAGYTCLVRRRSGITEEQMKRKIACRVRRFFSDFYGRRRSGRERLF